MECPRCGANLVTPASDHVCRERRPPIGWEITRWALVALAVGYAIAALVEFGLAAAAHHTLGSIRADDGAAVRNQRLADLNHLVSVARVADRVFWVLLVVLLVALVGWSRASAGLIRRNGGDDVRLMLRHWSLRAWSIALMISVVLGFAAFRPTGDTVDGALRLLWLMEIRYVLRAVAAAFLTAGVVLVGQRIRRFVADPAKPVFPASPERATGWRRQPTEEEDLWGWEPPSMLPPPRTSAPADDRDHDPRLGNPR
ncbi:hypothetical protein HC031_02415 [Planosporangium thailandense]|uniref:Uncharacterized protein n=1 Tax=Planosporangium thailandense TaxID=765197 RepID=A0ABX0XRF1_9ACTN|nr:hypothetical protein [Planosporangium thailandense]NJC68582.1 hypothetical protein [Planosporangium thailandense]